MKVRSAAVTRPDTAGIDPTSVFVENDGVRIHALDSGHLDGSMPAVLVVPGMGEAAEEYTWLFDGLGDRRVVIVDVRGRGGSDAPDAGYTWEDHIGDLRAVVEARSLDRPVLVAFSRGSSYALGYALTYPAETRGLVIGDYFARHVGLPAEIADQQLAAEDPRGTDLGADARACGAQRVRREPRGPVVGPPHGAAMRGLGDPRRAQERPDR